MKKSSEVRLGSPQDRKTAFRLEISNRRSRKRRFLPSFWRFGSPETQASHEKPAGKRCFLKVPSFSSSTLFWLRSSSKARLWWLRAQKSQNQVGQKKLGGPAGKAPREKNGVSIGNFQSEVPKKAISSHFLAFLIPLGKSRLYRRPPAPPPSTLW